ncbi:MAG: hypothetical protein EBY18_17110 [Alphaproteobacteria bacterium]|nr:hypothetical protein [Alphaproteobacteria bacterium]
MEASPYWYVRYYEDQKIYRRSTKQENKRDAIKAAQEFFAEIKLAKMNRLPVTKRSGFELCARGLLKENKARMERGELSKTKQEYDEARLENDLLPYFKKFEVAEIDYKALSGYLTYINTAERKLSTNSLKVHVSHIKTILKYAQRIGVITASARNLGQAHFAAVGAPVDTPFVGLPEDSSFAATFLKNGLTLDRDRVEAEAVEAGRALIGRHPDIDTVVLECTNLPPYKPALERALGLPVFDVLDLLRGFHARLIAAGGGRTAAGEQASGRSETARRR